MNIHKNKHTNESSFYACEVSIFENNWFWKKKCIDILLTSIKVTDFENFDFESIQFWNNWWNENLWICWILEYEILIHLYKRILYKYEMSLKGIYSIKYTISKKVIFI